jgi:hypothetical protein
MDGAKTDEFTINKEEYFDHGAGGRLLFLLSSPKNRLTKERPLYIFLTPTKTAIELNLHN